MARPISSGLFCLILLTGLIPGIFIPQSTSAVGAATLYVGPSSGTFTVGSTFTVSLYLNTGGQAVNAIEANLSFPPDKLQVVSPTTGKSLVQVWVSQPTYSNSQGTLKFQGAIPTPGINTESGLISTVTFRVKQTGVATLKLLDSSRVLLNDGKGTDVLGGTTSGIYNLILPPPAGPIVTSPTNPDQSAWYQVKNAIFQWDSSPDIQGFSYILNNQPIDIPDDISESAKTSINYDNLSDGSNYFHIKSLRAGSWGGVTHYGINVDNTPPAEFKIEISPSNHTSSKRPLLSFDTTDKESGIDHYELKIIPLDPVPEEGPFSNLYESSPFFIEAYSPYSQEIPFGRYDVLVRAFDKAGNFFQTEERLTITSSYFRFVRGEGLQFGELFTLNWFFVWIIALLILIVLFYLAKKIFGYHREVHTALELGAHAQPQIKDKAKALKEKLVEYGRDFGHGTHLFGFLLFLVIGLSALFTNLAFAQTNQPIRLPIEPPVVTLFPESISNDEILYIGGRAGAPDAEVIIYLQEIDTGSAISHTIKTDSTGAWFYSIPQFLNTGKYVVWTQLKIAEELSPPSSKFDLEVAPTAVQFGSSRLSYQSLYLTLLVIFLLATLSLLTFIIYHSYHHKTKSRRLRKEIEEAENAIRHGFKILKRDIEKELEVLENIKLTGEIKTEEKFREEKLLKDLEEIQNHIGEEVGDIDKLADSE